MDRLRVLITNLTLAGRSGTELYVRDLARALLARGHAPIVYSPDLGDLARELRATTVPVVDDLRAVAVTPDVIHGHHHPETMTALLHFPGVPAVYFCHDWVAWHDEPPRFPRILRYAAVSRALRDRLVLQHGVPEEQTRLLLNFVDLDVFKPRAPLPPRPARALVFSHNAHEDFAATVREACARAEVTLDVVGAGVGNVTTDPAALLGRYDVVFATGRSALEALAVGAAVVVCDVRGLGPMVTSRELQSLRELNFGLRLLRDPVTVDALARALASYDGADAGLVRDRIRAEAGLDAAVDAHLALYREVIAEHARREAGDLREEERAAGAYLRAVMPWKLIDALDRRGRQAEAERDQLRARLARLERSLAGRVLARYGMVKHRLLLPAYRRLGRLAAMSASALRARRGDT